MVRRACAARRDGVQYAHAGLVLLRRRTLTRTKKRFSSSVSAVAPFPVELLQNLVHPALLGGFAQPPLPALLGSAAAPALDRTFAVGPHLGSASLETGVPIGKIVPEDPVVEVTPVFEHPGLASNQQLDQEPKRDQRHPVGPPVRDQANHSPEYQEETHARAVQGAYMLSRDDTTDVLPR